MILEIAIGAALALFVFMASIGLDPTPLLFALAGLFAIRFLLDGKGLPGIGFGGKRRFAVADADGHPHAGVQRVTFEDIGGQETAKREFVEALDFVKNIERVRRFGIRPLKGILLSGPPGTGKTLLAKAAAGYTGSAFVAASGSEFVEMYAGVGAQRVRQLFRRAREAAQQQKKSSAVVFIDEIDVLGGKRGSNASHQEYDQTLNQLLVEMDGMKANDEVRVLVVAATNRSEALDQALMRPGRFDRIVRVDLPDREGRLHILKIHTRNKPLAPGLDLDGVARETFGFSGAHLESVCNEAAIIAMRRGDETIGQEHFREAIEKVLMGEKLDRRPSDEERRRVAYHELGHALVSESVSPGSVSSVTVTSRGQALGYMRQSPPEDRYLHTKQELLDQISTCLGGAVAEEIVFGERSTGSAGDFDQAVDLATRIVYAGLSGLGVVSRDNLPPDKLHTAIQEIIGAEEKRVRALVGEFRGIMDQLSTELIAEEKISGDRLRQTVGWEKEPSGRARTA